MTKETILSGMRPTGRLHLGNYLGALKNWVQLQDEYNCHYFIADWHALMSDYADPGFIKGYSMDMLCVWLAVGLDPEKCIMFRQSDVPEHLELFFILSTLIPLPWMERCPTYKEALENIDEKDIRNYSFLGYPALQAADITLYSAEKVPVGKDQLPHLEFTREVVRRFNNMYGTDVMVEPEPLLTEVQKLNGTDGRKMSKSYGNTILLTETEEDLRKKVMSMVTDPARIHPADKGHPEVCIPFSYHSIFSPGEVSDIESRCRSGSIGCVECKKMLLEELGNMLGPVREKYNYYIGHMEEVRAVLEDGNRRASEAAKQNLQKFRLAMKYD
ncbi:MAG: tryptophan--tRNA ligase [Elusimicrobiota bacterium]